MLLWLAPYLKEIQKRFIPLCYSLANNDQATTKLRICTNSSFKAQPKMPSFNECCISGPEYLNCLDSILTRWRFAAKSAHSDISKCYHRISTSPLDNSLHGLWLKPVLGQRRLVLVIFYIRTQLQLQGYWVPQAMKHLKKLQDQCKHCRRHKKQVLLHTVMGSVPQTKLCESFPFQNITSDICGPFVCRGFVNSRKTRIVYI